MVNTQYKPGRGILTCLGLLVAIGGGAASAAQGADPARELLTLAQQSSAKGDFKSAVQQYEDFLQKFANHSQTLLVKYGLSLALLQAPARDFSKISPLLDAAADDPKFADRAGALYWSGVVAREWARRGSAPAEATARLELSVRRFGEAARAYQALLGAWTDKGEKDLPAALESFIRCGCDQVDAYLALGKTKEAAEIAGGLSKQRWISRSRWRETEAYVTGCAFFAAEDFISAGRALVLLAPFEQPLEGPHARYLLARIHHLAGELTEAAQQYEAVPVAFETQVKIAREMLKSNGAPLSQNALERSRVETLLNEVPPDYVTDSVFHFGKLLYEEKKFTEALERFTRFVQRSPKNVRADEARYLAGVCVIQLGRYAEAIPMLQPLIPHPRLGALARGWLGRAVLRGADPAQAPAYKQALDQAAEHFKQASAGLAGRPESAAEAAELSFDLADTLRQAGRPADAASLYQKLIESGRGEEARARLIMCLQLSGKSREVEESFRQFEKEYPHSSFMAEALFHFAECSFAAAQAPGVSSPKPLYEEAVKRYTRLVAAYPDQPQVNLCRFRLATAEHALGHYSEAVSALTSIPEPERAGPLAASSYILADALLRDGPAVGDARDAVTAANRLEQLQLAAKALQTFLGAQPQGPDAPDAMLKLGYCQQQIAALLVEPQERVAAATAARSTYEQMRTLFPAHPLRAVAEFERVNSYVLAGDVASALSKLPRFHAEPFLKAPITPLALIRESQLLRGLGRAPEALAVLVECRTKYEEELKKDPARVEWVPLLRYHHALALKEAKQPAEAIKVFQTVVQDYPTSEWAKASKELLEETKP
jgi:TolA-binding protein